MTIDAMGCQNEIAQKSVDGGGDSLWNVKGNQPRLRDGIEQVLSTYLDDESRTPPVRSFSTHRKAHGREESRWRHVCTAPKNLPDRDRWPQRKSIGMVISSTTRDGKDCIDAATQS